MHLSTWTAAAAGVSQTAASQTWRASRLEPHLVEEFKVSLDPQPVDTARGVDGLHLNPAKAAAPRVQEDRHPDHRLHRTAPAFT